MAEERPRIEPREDGALGTITIYPGQFLYESRDRRGTTRKFVSSGALRQAVAGAGVDSGWFAPEVRRVGECGRGEWAVMSLPPARRRILLTTERKGAARPVVEVTLSLPAFVFFGLGSDYYVWAMRRAEFSPSAEVFRAPLPNVYPEGNICFGTNRPPRATGAGIARAWEMFITSPFNGDLAAGKSAACREDVRVMLRRQARAARDAVYPLRDLVKQVSGHSVTVERIVTHLIRNGRFE